MPDLRFEVTGAEVPPYAAVPTIVFALRIANADAGERIHSVALRYQVQIAVTRRRYSPEEKVRLVEIFGVPERWRDTLRSLLWTNTSAVVPGFAGATEAELPITCTYDFEVVSAKYFDALMDGEIPLTFLFSGTVFYENAAGALQAAPISWNSEAAYRLPVAVWREMMDRYFPNTAWIRLRKDVFDLLLDYRAEQGLATWEDTFARLLEHSREGVRQ